SDSMQILASQLLKEDPTSNPLSTAQTLEKYLEHCNRPSADAKDDSTDFDESHRNIEKHYLIKGKRIQVYYDSELVAKTIHPALEYLEVDATTTSDITFDVYIRAKQLYLYSNKELICCVPQQEYHRIQGKFSMYLLCYLHNKTERDWLGTFHGSTITDGNSSILFAGQSGKGKSTLCALLVASGFTLLADDVSPMLSGSQNIYYNPSALSIKKGAFKLLEPLVEGFNNLPITQFNTSKGLIKYMPCKAPKADFYPCKGIVLINYKANAETRLETVSIKTLLETLIPESWLSPNAEHAREFLDWLRTVKYYKLTYSNSKSVSQDISQLFHQLNKNE
ncbi:MAG: hypothetical protein NWP87_05155, partial [Winogradskyella sp.]|nr:hypothetical protein [Winogradskyella sp.]